MQEASVQSQGQEDPLEKGMATLSSIDAWRIAGTEEPGGLQSMGLQRLGQDLTTKQQQHWLFNKTGFALEVICQVQSLLVGSFWGHLPEALQEAGGLRCNTGPVPSA